MDCSDFLDRYSDYDDSLLPEAERQGFDAHLAECDACARYDRVLRKGRMLARQLPQAEPRSDLMPDLHLRLLTARLEPLGARSAPLLTGALTIATVLMVSSSVTWLLDEGASMPAEAVPVAWLADAATASSEREVSRAHAGTGAHAARSVDLPRLPASGPAPDPGDDHGATVPARSERSGRQLQYLATAWSNGGVDRRVPASYSPLVIGPPVYRSGTATPMSATTRRTLD